MGFFKDLKEDLSLAVSEFANEEKLKAAEEQQDDADVFAAAEEAMGLEHVEEEEASDDEYASDEEPEIDAALGSFLDQVAANAQEADSKYDETPNGFEKEAESAYERELESIYEKKDKAEAEKKAFGSTEEMNFAAKAAMAKAMVTATYEEKKKEENIYRESLMQSIEKEEPQVTDEVAVVTANMTIRGDMNSTGSLDIMGHVTGNIKVLGELNITGAVNGNCEAGNIVAINCDVIGDLVSNGPIKIGSNAIVRGNIYATSAVISGAVKGDIDVHGPVILDSTAIIMGNIKSKAVQINNGAAVEGMCSQCYAEVSPAAFFRD